MSNNKVKPGSTRLTSDVKPYITILNHIKPCQAIMIKLAFHIFSPLLWYIRLILAALCGYQEHSKEVGSKSPGSSRRSGVRRPCDVIAGPGRDRSGWPESDDQDKRLEALYSTLNLDPRFEATPWRATSNYRVYVYTHNIMIEMTTKVRSQGLKSKQNSHYL